MQTGWSKNYATFLTTLIFKKAKSICTILTSVPDSIQ